MILLSVSLDLMDDVSVRGAFSDGIWQRPNRLLRAGVFMSRDRTIFGLRLETNKIGIIHDGQAGRNSAIILGLGYVQPRFFHAGGEVHPDMEARWKILMILYLLEVLCRLEDTRVTVMVCVANEFAGGFG